MQDPHAQIPAPPFSNAATVVAPDGMRRDATSVSGLARPLQITSVSVLGTHDSFGSQTNRREASARTENGRQRHYEKVLEANRDDISLNSPLRLKLAAQLAFPAGGMTAAGLRREAAKGRLVTERIAGKDYTTLAAIEGMRALCRTDPKALDCGSGRRAKTRNQLGSLGTDRNRSALDAAQMIATKLRNGSRLT
jgi:hypothetical protein